MVLNKKNLAIAFSPSKGAGRTERIPVVANVHSPVSTIRVYVRVRPFKEGENSNRSLVKVCDKTSLIFDPKLEETPFYFHGVQQKGRDINKKEKKNMVFEFDRVFDDNAKNVEVYDATTKSIVKSVFEGYNCSVFAYGATGAGKTFTMIGSHSNPGITFLTISELLNHVEEIKETTEVTLAASYLEVYNENVKDLLRDHSPSLHLREDGGKVTVAGLKIVIIQGSDQLLDLLKFGNENRSQHPTDSNAESSRSHAVFQVHIKMVNRLNGQTKLSKLSMIDLAGSERGAATGCSGIRFKEGSNINKSLLALGKCINALADGLKHVPYRDSKLTRILKDSLGGNCQTVMVANVSPTESSFEDTYNTLKYAIRAKNIKSKLTKNVVSNNMTIPQYKALVEKLNEKIASLESMAPVAPPNVDSWLKEIDSVMSEKKFVHEKLLNLQSEQKMLEWRIKTKKKSIILCDPNMDMQVAKLNTSLAQLQARFSSISRRLEDYQPLQIVNAKRKDALMEKIKAANVYNLVENKILLWEEQIKSMEQTMGMKHIERIFKFQLKVQESHQVAVGSIMPVLNECYNLLRAHGHVTKSLTDKFEDASRSLDGVKGVTWSCGDSSEEEEDLDDNRLYLLSVSSNLQSNDKDDSRKKWELTAPQKQIMAEKPKTKFVMAEKRPTPLKTVNAATPPPKGRRMTPAAKSISSSKIKNCINKENLTASCTTTTPQYSARQKLIYPTNSLKINRTKTHSLRSHPYQNSSVTSLSFKNKRI